MFEEKKTVSIIVPAGLLIVMLLKGHSPIILAFDMICRTNNVIFNSFLFQNMSLMYEVMMFQKNYKV